MAASTRAALRLLAALAALALLGLAQGTSCPFQEFRCANGECIDGLDKCDGTKDCSDGSDETAAACASSCPATRFRCDNGQCIPAAYQCDGGTLCRDGSDESPEACEACGVGMVRCPSGRCIYASWQCDGRKDCADGWDESAAACAACGPSSFRCNSGQCVYGPWRCDGEIDCLDGSDETESTCSAHSAELAVAEARAVSFHVGGEVLGEAALLLCDGAACAGLRLGRSASGEPLYQRATGCQWPLTKIAECKSLEPEPAGWHPLPKGEHSFMVERRASRLAVWPAGRSDSVGVVDAPAGASLLRLRPEWWGTDFVADLHD